MKLFGNLKKEDNAQTREEAWNAIKKAGMRIDDNELEAVSGGTKLMDTFVEYDSPCEKNDGGGHNFTVIRNIYICLNCGKTCKDKLAW
ncbi:MAG: hypothetical protein IK152_00010 [Lachnospiraceae bacterium]|nr:hypothetical protein [Lachnospiraceae bacterium]